MIWRYPKNDRIFPKVSQKPMNPLGYLWDTSINPIKNNGVTIETSERLPAKNQRIVPRGPGASQISGWDSWSIILIGGDWNMAGLPSGKLT